MLHLAAAVDLPATAPGAPAPGTPLRPGRARPPEPARPIGMTEPAELVELVRLAEHGLLDFVTLDAPARPLPEALTALVRAAGATRRIGLVTTPALARAVPLRTRDAGAAPARPLGDRTGWRPEPPRPETEPEPEGRRGRGRRRGRGEEPSTGSRGTLRGSSYGTEDRGRAGADAGARTGAGPGAHGGGVTRRRPKQGEFEGSGVPGTAFGSPDTAPHREGEDPAAALIRVWDRWEAELHGATGAGDAAEGHVAEDHAAGVGDGKTEPVTGTGQSDRGSGGPGRRTAGSDGPAGTGGSGEAGGRVESGAVGPGVAGAGGAPGAHGSAGAGALVGRDAPAGPGGPVAPGAGGSSGPLGSAGTAARVPVGGRGPAVLSRPAPVPPASGAPAPVGPASAGPASADPAAGDPASTHPGFAHAASGASGVPASDAPASDGLVTGAPASDGPASGGPGPAAPANGGPASAGPVSDEPASAHPAPDQLSVVSREFARQEVGRPVSSGPAAPRSASSGPAPARVTPPRPASSGPSAPAASPRPVRVVDAGAGAVRVAAARWADVVLVRVSGLAQAAEVRAELRAEACRFGRDPDTVKVLVSMRVDLGDGEYAAEPGHGGGGPRPTPRGPLYRGGPVDLADLIGAWYGERAVDGFHLVPAEPRRDLERLVNGTVPLLQHRGLFRTFYPGGTLRDHLGLPRPAPPVPR